MNAILLAKKNIFKIFKKKSDSITIINSKISKNVQIGEHVKIINGVTIAAKEKIEIGRYTSIIGPNTNINNQLNEISIGSFCSIAPNVTIQEYNHYTNKITTYYINKNIFKTGSRYDVTSKGGINIGHDVWIGTNSIILSGVTIGNGAIIAANSVVTKDVPEYSIYGGNPAKFIKQRFNKDVTDFINNLEWWYWDIDKILNNKELFNSDINYFKNIIIH